MKTALKITQQIRTSGLMRTRFIFAAVLILIIAAGIVLTGELERMERKHCVSNCRNEAALLQSQLMSNIDPVDRNVLTMSGSPWLQGVLTSNRMPDLERANSVLDRYQKSMDVSVCYLINAAGMTVASSNRHAADSFMGKSFEFRPYFTEAIAGRPGRYFARGSVSNIRGYYSSAPVRDNAGRIVGVAVIKKDLDAFENVLSQWPHSYVVSPEGIIFLSSEPQLVFRSLWPVTTGKRDELVKSRQFGALNFEPVLKQEPVDATYMKYDGELHDLVRLPLPVTGWSIVYLNSADELVNYRLFGVLLTLFACVLALFGYFALAQAKERRMIAEERLQKEAALRESELEFRGLLEQAPLAITVVNSAGEIEYINRKNVEIVGYTHDETPTLAIWWSLAYPDPEERKKIAALWGDIKHRVLNGENIGTKERTITCKDGTRRDVELSYARAGEKIIVIFNDVTARKRMEADLLTVHKLEAVGLLAGGIAHDFNNTLNVICGNLSLAMMIGVPDKAADLLREAESACEKSKDLGARLITFSKGGSPLLERQPVGEIIREALNMLTKPDNISIELGPMIDGTVEADRRQIYQVLRSLLINAVEAMPQGGIVRIETRDMKLNEKDIPSLYAGEYVRISVADNGIGILPEHLPKIFDPYFSTKERFSDRGMGLGLAVCWSIVRKHGGAITVESIVGTGSVFHVYLRST